MYKDTTIIYRTVSDIVIDFLTSPLSNLFPKSYTFEAENNSGITKLTKAIKGNINKDLFKRTKKARITKIDIIMIKA